MIESERPIVIEMLLERLPQLSSYFFYSFGLHESLMHIILIFYIYCFQSGQFEDILWFSVLTSQNKKPIFLRNLNFIFLMLS